METDKLIQNLAEMATPVRPLSSPWVRTMAWLAIAVPYIALVVYVVSPRADLLRKLWEFPYLLEQVAAFATGVAAAAAAFSATIPGNNRKALLLPLAPLAVWLGTLGLGCIQDWLKFGVGGLSFKIDLFCLPAIVLVGAVPAIAMVVMLRRGAPLMPCITIALGGLAAAGLGNFGLRLFHTQDASLMVLVWQVGSVFVLAGMAACTGKYILNWTSIIGFVRHRATAR